MIQIVTSRAEWPAEFREVGHKMRSALGGQALSIHHIGSTSVSNLAAKDVLDIQLTVDDLNAPIEEKLSAVGFRKGEHTTDHCPPGLMLPAQDLEKRYYRGLDRAIHLHVRKAGAFNQKYALLFRDFLRTNPMARNAYAEVKLQLAKRFPQDADSYYDIKDPVCDLIMAGALEWAKSTHWQIPATDV